jgi:hypothetical protein
MDWIEMQWTPLTEAWPPLNRTVFVLDATGSGKDPVIKRAIWGGGIDNGGPVMLLEGDGQSQTPGATWAWTSVRHVEEVLEGLA